MLKWTALPIAVKWLKKGAFKGGGDGVLQLRKVLQKKKKKCHQQTTGTWVEK